MKNLNKVREYTGNYFWFENELMMYNFIYLYKDEFINYEFIENIENGVCLKVTCKKGVIPSIRKGLKKLVVCKGHNRYFIKAS